jgi:SAM-dependent methyltransferase
MGEARLYGELSELWRYVSPPENYVEEVATFVTRFRRHGVPDGGRVLHLGSGGGSIDYHLKQTYAVTGVDISPEMLAYARRINPEVAYLEGDIRTVRLGETFDAVLLHDAISYMTSIEELEMAYRTASAHLEVGGVMVTLPEELRTRLANNAPEVSTESDGRKTVTMIEVVHDEDPSDHQFENTFVFLIREASDLRVEVDRHINGVFELEEFTGAMQSAGFETFVEDWELSDWTPGQEMPLITAIRRK